MNLKRWIALGGAVALVFIAMFISFLSNLSSTNWSSFLDDMSAIDSTYSENVIQTGAAGERIAVLHVDGVIQDTGSASSLFGAVGYNHGIFMDQLNLVLEDDTVKAIVLTVNSPGGGVVESAQIYDKIREIQTETEKPIYVSMGAIAASGGYYIAAPAEKIFVHRETLTGSIGVIMQSINYGQLAEDYGIDFVTIKSGEFKDIMSPTRDMTDAEREFLEEMLDDSYQDFVQIIKDGRNLSDADLVDVADGRIFNGRQAVEVNLADDFGYFEDVVDAIQADYQLEDAQVFEYGTSSDFASLFALKARSFFGTSIESELIANILTNNSAPRLMYLYGDN